MFARRRNEKYKNFLFSMRGERKTFKYEIWYAWDKNAGNLDFVENSHFIRERIEVAIHGCCCITSEENISSEVLL